MKTKKLLAFSASLLMTYSASSVAAVESVTFEYSANAAKQTVFEVAMVNGKLTLKNPNVQMALGQGTVACEKKHNFTGAELYLGPVTVSGNSLNKAQAKASDWTVDVASLIYIWSINGGYSQVGEAGDTPLVFDLAVNNISDNYFNPVDVVAKELQKAKQGGMSEAEFLGKTRLFHEHRIVTLAGKCSHKNNSSFGYGAKQVNADFMVRYVGSPSSIPGPQQVAPTKKIVAVPLGGSGQIASPYGITITGSQLIAPSGNFKGQCPANVNFQAQLVAQGKGGLRFHVKRNGMAVYTSPELNYNGGNVYHNFNVMAELHGKPLNTEQNFDFTMYVKTQGNPNEAWTDWQQLDSYQWRQTCTPMTGQQAAGGAAIKMQQPAPESDPARLAPPPAPSNPARLAPPPAPSNPARLAPPPAPSDPARLAPPPAPSDPARLAPPPAPSAPASLAPPPSPSAPARLAPPPSPSAPARLAPPPSPSAPVRLAPPPPSSPPPAQPERQ